MIFLEYAVVTLAVLGALIYIVRRFYEMFRKQGCGSNCGCPTSAGAKNIRRTEHQGMTVPSHVVDPVPSGRRR